MTSGTARPVVRNGVEYPSMAAAARAEGISRQAMHMQQRKHTDDAPKQTPTETRRRAVESELSGTTFAMQVNVVLANEDHECCWHCSGVPDELAYTYFGARLCGDCWNRWWLTTEDGESDPPFLEIKRGRR